MERRTYGVPYKGGKSAIAADIVGALPGGAVFVDMMAGGCAVTHAAMRSGRYGRFIANDLDWRGVTLFRDAVFGCYREERRIVDRSYFEANKRSDAYVALCWSFGANGESYLWNEETEGAKLRACRMVMGETWQERSAAYRDFVKYLQDRRAELAGRRARAAERQREVGEAREYLRGILCEALRVSGYTQTEVNKHLGTQMSGHYFGRSQWLFPTRSEYGKLRELLTTLPEYDALGRDLERLERLERLGSLGSLGRLESLGSLGMLDGLGRLERLRGLEGLAGVSRLDVRVGDYRSVEVPEGAVVYCDPPYRGTDGYFGVEFDHEAFYGWLRACGYPVWVSEYSMPGDFVPVWRREKRVTMPSARNDLRAVEALWLHERWAAAASRADLFEIEK